MSEEIARYAGFVADDAASVIKYHDSPVLVDVYMRTWTAFEWYRFRSGV